jgi:hypothetical protein
MQRYLLVLDIDQPVTDEELDRGPVSYLAARQDQQPADVVVLSLASAPKLPAMDLILGAATSAAIAAPVVFPRAPQPDHDVSATAEHRMNRTVQHLKATGGQASGIISDEDLLRAVRAETSIHHYDQVVLATSRQYGSWLARLLHTDPVHRLRWHWRKPLVVFPLGHPGADRAA